jgi:RimJ/RimL family protein N-acetyltransferase
MIEPAPPVPDFETSRLRLRRLTAGDAAGLHEAYGDAETMRFWDAPPSRDRTETEQRIARSLAVDSTWHAAWAVLGREDGRFLGMVNYHARQPWNRRLAVGWILVPSARRQGFMAEAMNAVLPHCFGVLATHRIEAEIEPDNIRSARLAGRLGFRREALLRDRLCVAGEYRSVWMHALLRPDWRGPTPV